MYALPQEKEDPHPPPTLFTCKAQHLLCSSPLLMIRSLERDVLPLGERGQQCMIIPDAPLEYFAYNATKVLQSNIDVGRRFVLPSFTDKFVL